MTVQTGLLEVYFVSQSNLSEICYNSTLLEWNYWLLWQSGNCIQETGVNQNKIGLCFSDAEQPNKQP